MKKTFQILFNLILILFWIWAGWTWIVAPATLSNFMLLVMSVISGLNFVAQILAKMEE